MSPIAAGDRSGARTGKPCRILDKVGEHSDIVQPKQDTARNASIGLSGQIFERKPMLASRESSGQNRDGLGMSRVQKFEKRSTSMTHSLTAQSSNPRDRLSPDAPDETLPKALSRLHYSARVS